MPPPLALTLGEPAGIGPDLAIALWRRRSELGLPAFYVIADRQFLARRALHLGTPVPVADTVPHEAAAVFAAALPVFDLGVAVTAAPGRPDASSAPAAIAAIRIAVRHVLAGEAGAIVTNPVAKNVLYRSGFLEPGHTEFLARLAAEATGVPARPVMMLWSPELAVVPVTIHLPLMQVPAALDSDLIFETGRITARDLARRFAIAKPRLAVAGLNPHAGEEGAMGGEDIAIVRPAVERLKRHGIAAHGPLPAVDIAGSGRADPSSLIAAIRLASRLAACEDMALAT
jgi:4-hydroxythreonine-4-phosphate dehydrogenase